MIVFIAYNNMTAGIRILILSDLHIEFGDFQTPDPSLYDIVI